jgi:hypothetical protein
MRVGPHERGGEGDAAARDGEAQREVMSVELHDAADLEIALAAEARLDQVMGFDPLRGGESSEADALTRKQGARQVAPVLPLWVLRREDRLAPLLRRERGEELYGG